MRIIALVLAVTLALLPAAHGDAGASDGAPAFALRDLPGYGGEPNLEVGADGAAYVVYPDWPGSRIWRLDDGATSFTDLGRPNLFRGGGDEDIAVGPDGTLVVVGMYWATSALGQGWCSSATVSRDRGDTWGPTVDGICAVNKVDRPYVALDESGAIWILQHAYCCLGQHSVHRSTDGGVTFLPVSVATPIGNFPGNIFVAHGRIHAATTCDAILDAVCMMWSPTVAPMPAWASSGPIRMTAPPPGLAHSTGAMDDAGNLYLAWTEIRSGGVHVFAARSTDGLTWTAPERLSSGNAATMPWVVAGADGRAAVAWYEADVRGDPNSVPATAAWRPRVAVRTAWDEGSGWEQSTIATRPNHYGPLCTTGASCSVDRDLLDYFELAVGPDGRLHVAFSDDTTWNVRYGVQTSGARLR